VYIGGRTATPNSFVRAMLFVFIELAVFAGAFVVAGDLMHFTWWGVGALIIADAVEIWPPASRELRDRLRLGTTVMSCMVSVGVVGLSAMRCGLFGATFGDMRLIDYFLGNWALHFHPCIRSIARWKPTSVAVPTLDVARLFAVYCTVSPPVVAYDCEIPSGTVAAVGILGAVVIEAALLFKM
jgi:hypothetical protein